MTSDKITIGKQGEELAVVYLQQAGYLILERNFRNTLGEIDIIAREGGAICFIEVKTRRTDFFGAPYESVTPAKQRKIAQVGLSYLKLKDQMDIRVRFDVVSIVLNAVGKSNVELFKNAFEAY